MRTLEWQQERAVECLRTISKECDEVSDLLAGGLVASGLRVTRSFDLLSARRALRFPEGCPCPHHGTADCSCQYVVLLVESTTGGPLTLVAHGRDGATHVSIDSTGSGEAVRQAVRELLIGMAGSATDRV